MPENAPTVGVGVGDITTLRGIDCGTNLAHTVDRTALILMFSKHGALAAGAVVTALTFKVSTILNDWRRFHKRSSVAQNCLQGLRYKFLPDHMPMLAESLLEGPFVR